MSVRDQRRINRAEILSALHEETGSFGGASADERVPAFIDDPIGSNTREFGYVGGLAIQRFYVDPSKPNATERRNLWSNIKGRIDGAGPNPDGWDGSSRVLTLQAIVEGTIE